jgi:hypothetical protein
MATYYKYSQLSSEQKQQIVSRLQNDHNRHFLDLYLQQITGNRPVDFGGGLILSSDAAWEAIATWGRTSEANLPVGERGNWHTLAGRLLSYIERTQIGQSTQAGIAYYNILEQAKNPLPTTDATLPEYRRYTDTQSLRRLQYEALNAQALGLLRDKISQSKFLQRFKNNPRTYSILSALLVANSENLRDYDDKTTSRVNQFLLPYAGVDKINQVAHYAYSDAGETDLKELSQIINSSVQADYGGDEVKFRADFDKLRSLSTSSPTFSNIAEIVHSIASGATTDEKEALTTALRREILASARGQHVSGQDLLARAIKSTGLSDQLGALAPLSFVLEEIETTQRQKLLGNDIFDKDLRSLGVYSLAQEIGVSPEVFWLSDKDLAAISEKLVPGDGSNKNSVLLQNAYQSELSRGKDADLTRLGQLSGLLDLHQQRVTYLDKMHSDSFFATRERLVKLAANLNARSQPLDKFIAGLVGGYGKVDNIINWPARTALNTWDKLIDITSIPLGKSGLKFPILAPASFLLDRWVDIEKRVALWNFKWTKKLAKKHQWYSGFFQQISDYSKLFFKSDGDWSHTNFKFFEKNWGNLLNWAAKKATNQSLAKLKDSLGKRVIAWGMSFAPGLTEKIVKIVGAGTTELGIGFLILGAKVLWEAGKSLFGKFFGFLSSIFKGKSGGLEDAAATFFGGAAIAVNALLLGAPVMIMAAFEVLRALWKMIWEGLVMIFVLAATVSIVLIAVVFLLFQVLKTTVNLDSGVAQLAANIVCNLTGSAAPNSSSNPQLAAGKCVYQLLSQFHINPLNRSNSAGVAFSAFSTSLGNGAAADVAQASAQQFGAFQCVALDTMVSVMTGGSVAFYANAKDMLSNPPPGYRPVFGVGSCAPGDFFVDTGGTWGHTGIFVENAGANIVCMDANSDGYGTVRDDTTCRWPTNKIAGCLKKN